MSRFSDYHDAIIESDGDLDWKHELVDRAGVVFATTDADEADRSDDVVEWGAEVDPLDFQRQRVSQQTTALTLPVNDSRLIPGTRSGLLHPDTRNLVRSSAGLITGTGTVWWTQSSLLVNQTSGTAHAGLVTLDLDLADATLPIVSDFVTAFSFDEGEPVEDVVGRILAEVLPSGSYSLPPTGYTTLAGSIPERSDRYALVTNLLEGCGYELVATRDGLVIARPIPAVGEDVDLERWRYGDGANSIPVENLKTVWRSRRPRGWKAEGGATRDGAAPPTAIAYDLDPLSEGCFCGLDTAAEIGESRYPYAGDPRQLQAAAYGQLRRHGVGPRTVTFDTLPNPAMRPGDLLDLADADLGIDHGFRVIGYSLPLQGERFMTVTARQVWDPTAGFLGPGIDPRDDCLISINDDFDRSDGDLQLLPGGQTGSAEWTEIGYSWGIADGIAVQRYRDGWSLAFYNEALCASDQYAEATIRRVPSGRHIGPVVRCSGKFDGYAALVSPDRLSLEVWLAGQKAADLGTYKFPGSPIGSTIRVQAVGSTVTAQVNGTTVITATDSKLVGRFVGMLAYGGSPENAPGLKPFDAGPVV